MEKANVNSKLITLGNSYAFIIPKALVDCKVLEAKKRYTLKVEEVSEGLVKAVILRLVRVVNDSISKFINDIHKATQVKRLNNPLTH
jgi:hypothetical protein